MEESKVSSSSKSIDKLTILIVLTVVNLGLVAFAYKELSSIRRDLYGVRADYYGIVEEGVSSNLIDEANESFSYTLKGQEVKNLRISSGYNVEDNTENYDKKSIRVVQIEITNSTDINQSYYDNISIVDENGRIIRSSVVHPDDDQNSWVATGLELAPGGKSTVYLYFPDTGKEITQDDLKQSNY